jgi:hypothetical protein
MSPVGCSIPISASVQFPWTQGYVAAGQTTAHRRMSGQGRMDPLAAVDVNTTPPGGPAEAQEGTSHPLRSPPFEAALQPSLY